MLPYQWMAERRERDGYRFTRVQPGLYVHQHRLLQGLGRHSKHYGMYHLYERQLRPGTEHSDRRSSSDERAHEPSDRFDATFDHCNNEKTIKWCNRADAPAGAARRGYTCVNEPYTWCKELKELFVTIRFKSSPKNPSGITSCLQKIRLNLM